MFKTRYKNKNIYPKEINNLLFFESNSINIINNGIERKNFIEILP